MNLVSLQSELDLPVRHFIDSLTLLPCIPPGTETVLDIGSGAGFPAIPVKIMRTDLHMTMLEASREKSSFLKEAIRRLGLKKYRRPELPPRRASEKRSETVL